MKKWVKWFCASLIALVAVLSVSCGRCKYDTKAVDVNPTVEDSAWFSTLMNAKNNPQFTDIADVCKYQRDEGKVRFQDSVFFSLPHDVLINVAQVLVNRKIPLTKSNIVNEFSGGKDIYLNLDKIDQFKSLDPPDIDKDSIDCNNDD